jgi:predicted DNA-binding ribbon-helix-helix protein
VNVDGSSAELPQIIASPQEADFQTEFRVVTRQGTRRGIRLEQFFWSILKALAKKQDTTIGNTVEDIAAAHPSLGNLTSTIRVVCGRWLAEQNSQLNSLASPEALNALLLACPSPAFTLSSTRKIVSFNRPFEQLVWRQLPVSPGAEARRELKLTLDLNIVDLFARLNANKGVPITTGYVLAAGERRYRGQVNAIKAPVSGAELLLAFVI